MDPQENRVEKGDEVSCLACCKKFFVAKGRVMKKPEGTQRWGWCRDCRDLELPRRATQNRLDLPLSRLGFRPQ